MSSGSEASYPGRGRVISTSVFETGPPIPVVQSEVLNTTKTEEWTTKKKTDKLVTKQIETRVKREIVVTDDGEIIEDSGPQVTTDTTEESRTEEQENTEHKTSGCLDDPGPGWSLVPGSKVISETKQSNNSTHETKEEKTDTEITEEIGGLTREEINEALKRKEIAALRARDSSSTDSPGRILQSSQSHKVIDTEEVNEVSEFKDGEVSTETKKTSNREEFFDDDLPEDEAIAPNWPGIAQGCTSPTSTSSRRKDKECNTPTSTSSRRKDKECVTPTSTSSRKQNKEHVVRVRSPATPLQDIIDNDRWETVSEQLRRKKREETLRRLSEPEEPSGKRVSTYIEKEDTVKRNTFDWVENHFGSQDLEESGLTGNGITARSNDGSLHRVSSPNSHVHHIPITSEDGSLRRVHYTKRQQMPSGRATKSPAPPPPPQMPRQTSKANGLHSTYSSFPKKQYYLGEDPGVGVRFTGMTGKVANGSSPQEERSHNSHSLSRNARSKPASATVKFATMGHDENRHRPNSSLTKKKTTFHQPEVDLESPPSVNEIIHSLRSKAYLEKENSAVSIRDDDSVFGPMPGQQLYRPTRPPRHNRLAKQHVIKIAIKSDDSDCSSPVNSPRYSGTPTPQYPNSASYERGANDSIVRNAINNLLKNRLNSSSDKSPGSSAYNSLSRQPRGSNLTSRTYLTISSPNVNRIEMEPRVHYSPIRHSTLDGSRSQSIGNLSNGYGDYRSTKAPHHYTTSINDLNSNRHETKRHQFMQRLLDNRTSPGEEYGKYRKYVPRTYSPASASPPSSPTYTNRIKLPSPVPPSRSSSSPPPSPRSPPPPLTRPFSPYIYHNNNRSYEYHSGNDYSPLPKPNYHRSRSSPRIYSSRSPSPPPFSRRPPSPVLPKGSSIGDDDSSNASGRSRSTNQGSRGSDISHPGERVEAVTKRKVTTTTTKKREFELPDNDYYYERSLPRDKSKSVVHIWDRGDSR